MAVPEDVERAPVKKLVAPSAPTTAHREEHIASRYAVFRSWCRECCIERDRMHQHRAEGRETAILAIAIDCGNLNDRVEQLQETTRAPILVSKCDRERWIVAAIVPTKGTNEYAIAELKWLRGGSRQVGQRAGFVGPEGVSSDSVEAGRCDCQD